MIATLVAGAAHSVHKVARSEGQSHELVVEGMAAFVEGYHKADAAFKEFDRRCPGC